MLQEARIAAWKAQAKVQGHGALPSTVICKAAQWAVRDYLRARRNNGYWRRHPEWQAPLSLDALPDRATLRERLGRLHWEELTLGEETRTVCENVLAKLPERYRMLFQRYYFRGDSQTAMAKEQGVSINRIYQMISYCRNAIRAELGVEERGYGRRTEQAKNYRRARNPARREKLRAAQQRWAARQRERRLLAWEARQQEAKSGFDSR